MRWRRILPALALALAACGGTASRDSPIKLVTDSFGLTQTQVSPRFAAVFKAEAPLLQVSFVEAGISSNLVLERRDGAFDYWLSPDGAHLILQSGMLHSTRGVGEGLLASELSEPLALVRNRRAGVSDRFHTYLDGNDRTVTRTYRCVVTNEGRKEIALATGPVRPVLMTENCRSLDQEFVNFYWVMPSSGQIVQSRQWAGPVSGAISTRIVPR